MPGMHGGINLTGLGERWAGFGFAPNSPMNPNGPLAGGAQKVKSLQSQLYKLQMRCMAGEGKACHQAKIVEQQLSQAQAQQQGALNIERMRGDRGTMGINGRGRRGTDPADISAAMLQNMYGSGGGGGLGSSNMGGGGW